MDANSVDMPSIKKAGGFKALTQSPYLFGLALVCIEYDQWAPTSLADNIQFSSLGGFLFGYDQGVVSGVLTMESFGAAFPRVFADSSFKGWFVAILLLAAWFGSLVNGPLADKYGRKMDMIVAVIIFLVGSAVQAGAVNIVMLFIGMIPVRIRSCV